MCTQNHRAGCMQQQKACSSAWARPHPLPRRSWDRAGSHPSTQNKMTHERKQTKTEESHPGWRRRAEAPLRGRGLHLMNASGLGRCEWKWGGQKEEMRGMGGDSRREKEQSCSLGQIFCCFIRFSVNQLVFARTGERRGVLKRARAREERDHENGHHQLPRGLHLAVIICTNSVKQNREGAGQPARGRASRPP